MGELMDEFKGIDNLTAHQKEECWGKLGGCIYCIEQATPQSAKEAE